LFRGSCTDVRPSGSINASRDAVASTSTSNLHPRSRAPHCERCAGFPDVIEAQQALGPGVEPKSGYITQGPRTFSRSGTASIRILKEDQHAWQSAHLVARGGNGTRCHLPCFRNASSISAWARENSQIPMVPGGQPSDQVTLARLRLFNQR
jgi:hypothetical protein